MNVRAVAGICGFALAAGLASTAQAQTTEAPAPQQPGTTFRSGVTLIRTDVIVRDATGAFVPDLTVDDFRILEDGVRQEVASLILVHGGRVFNQLVPPPPVHEGIILPERRVHRSPRRAVAISEDIGIFEEAIALDHRLECGVVDENVIAAVHLALAGRAGRQADRECNVLLQFQQGAADRALARPGG